MRFPTVPEPSPLSVPPSLTDAPETVAFREGPPPLAIYVHWPFCQSKCPYCDFNSYARRTISEEDFLKAALRELDHYADETAERVISSIFFGGGTPSLMAAETVSAILGRIVQRWTMTPACEITIEANPSSVETARFKGYRSAGVNRVSLGVQALSDDVLHALGRRHTADEGRHALTVAHKIFERVSFDLIYARPGQTEAEWRAELKDALGLACGHLSLYQLTIEPETAFFDLERRGKLTLPDKDFAADLYTATQEMCEAAGLSAYEISNHAAVGEESRHNLTYWRYGDYLGIGPGAHGRLSVGALKYATATPIEPAAWYKAVFESGAGCAAARIALDPHQQAQERVITGLRLREGLDLDALSLTGFTLASQSLAPFIGEGMLRRDGSSLKATSQGRLVLNALIEALTARLEPGSEFAMG